MNKDTELAAIQKNLKPVASALKKGVGEVWKMFIRRYIAKGVSELFAAGVITVIAVEKLGSSNWIWLPMVLVLALTFDAINLLINPSYFAAADIIERLK